ncbi:MAG: hypothetical protein Q9212_006864, partial [Teloschistes hypoglaucus]
EGEDDEDELGIPDGADAEEEQGQGQEQEQQQQAQPSQQEQDDSTQEAGGQQTREEFRQILNPLDQELYELLGDLQEELKRKRKRDDGEADANAENNTNQVNNANESEDLVSETEDPPARGSGKSPSPPPPPPPRALPRRDSASSPTPTKGKKLSFKDLPPSEAALKNRPLDYSIEQTSIDPEWNLTLLPEPKPWDVPEGTKSRRPVTFRDEYGGYIKWGWRMLEFVRSDHGYESGWIGVKPLGEGSFGRAGLWEKRDENGQVIDRICIKQIKQKAKDWMFETDFGKPQEVKVLEDIGQWKSVNIIQLRGYRRYPKSRLHRLYLEYCEHGDLGKLITKSRLRKRYIPEEFIWEVFYRMAMACRTLAIGPRPAHEIMTDWVHRDLKPENIFLASPMSYEDDGIPFYPTAKMGDFGGAIGTGKHDPGNPMKLKGMGTVSYRAPEQKWPQAYDQKDEYSQPEIEEHWPKLGSHTNVWEVGACMYKLMTLTDVEFQFWKKLNKNGNMMNKIKTNRLPVDYSAELRNLVFECLKFDPIKRPNIHNLQERVEQGRDKFRNAWWKGEAVQEDARILVANDELNQMKTGDWSQWDSQALSSGAPAKTYHRTGEIPFNYPA